MGHVSGYGSAMSLQPGALAHIKLGKRRNRHSVDPGSYSRAMNEGREARKDGKPRLSPYDDVGRLHWAHMAWCDGWDAMHGIVGKSLDVR
jgi:hypothetical protein